jgi:hypothetical protein
MDPRSQFCAVNVDDLHREARDITASPASPHLLLVFLFDITAVV